MTGHTMPHFWVPSDVWLWSKDRTPKGHKMIIVSGKQTNLGLDDLEPYPTKVCVPCIVGDSPLSLSNPAQPWPISYLQRSPFLTMNRWHALPPSAITDCQPQLILSEPTLEWSPDPRATGRPHSICTRLSRPCARRVVPQLGEEIYKRHHVTVNNRWW